LAARLRSLGVKRNALVGIHMERSVEMVIAVLAVLRAGGAYVPLDPGFPRDRLALMIEDGKLGLILTTSELARELSPQAAQILVVDPHWSGTEPAPPETAGADHLAYVLFTSGSTGRPKGVQVTHRSLVNFLISMQREPGFEPDDVLLAVTTLSFDIAGLELFLPLISGGRVLIASRQMAANGESLAEEITRRGVTIMQATPTTWRLLLAARWSGKPDLKILCGGEAFPADLARQLVPLCAELWNMYGPTETTVWSTCCRIVDPGQLIHIGRPINNTTAYILDRRMRPAPIGVPGELFLGGEGVALGYLDQPELTRERFVPDPFADSAGARLYRTGDLARLLPDGNIQFLGRMDLQVKIRGYRIELGEIENVLARHPAVRECAVVARDDNPNNPHLAAYVVLGEHREASEGVVPDLRALLRSKLPEYMVPSVFAFLPALPRTPNGKIDRKALPAPKPGADATGSTHQALTTPVEKRVAAIWTRVLNAANIERDDNFFDLGGNSLLAATVFAEMEHEFGRRLPLSTLFERPTVAALAEAVRDDDAAAANWSSLVVIQRGKTGTPFFCVHGAGGNVLLYRDLVESMGDEIPFYGLQSVGLDGKTAPLETIEEMATHYISEVRSCQPHGPYRLGGYCMGGTVALEMAQQLHLIGERVEFLALLDTYNFTRALPTSPARAVLQRLRFHASNLARLRLSEIPGYLAEKFRVARDGGIASWLGTAVLTRTKAQRAPGGVPLRTLQALNDRAAEVYVPKPYPGRMTLFRPEVNYHAFPDRNMGWAQIAEGDLEVVELPMNPHAMLVQPFVRSLAAALNARLSGDPPASGRGADAGGSDPERYRSLSG
jgi:amino acid adenylation domain-containing protein